MLIQACGYLLHEFGARSQVRGLFGYDISVGEVERPGFGSTLSTMLLSSVSLVGIALMYISVAVCSGQVQRIEVVSVGISADFDSNGSVEITVEVPHSQEREKALAIHVRSSNVDEKQKLGVVRLTSKEVAAVIDNLQQIVDESKKSSDDLIYRLAGQTFAAGFSSVGVIDGENRKAFWFGADGAVAMSFSGSTVETRRRSLNAIIELLKKGQAVLNGS